MDRSRKKEKIYISKCNYLYHQLRQEELEEMAGSTLSAAQLQIISSRLASMKALL